MPGQGGPLYVGWGLDGHPVLTTNSRLLTQNAHDMLSGNVAIPFPFDADQASFTPQALEFAEMAQPIDNPDEGRNFTEDVVSVSCTNGKGSVQFIQIKELTLLDAIMRGQLEWQIGGVRSYSLIVPNTDTGTLDFVLFSPGDASSNELAYRTFLLKTIKTLATIDRKQIPPDQKGYMDVLRAAVANLEEKARSRQSPVGGVTKIMGDLGILQEVEVKTTNQLAYLSVNQLRYIIQKCQEVVSRSFVTGKDSS